jgi:UDP-2-acetamido-3-amino-2,3-dideoxy-glucuronate N-acetyltransferase
VTVGFNARVEPGAVVTRAVPAQAIVEGNPARIVGYQDAPPAVPSGGTTTAPAVQASRVAGVTLHHLPLVRDMRGNLTVGEFEQDIPFRPARYFLVFDVPRTESRGGHAHHACHQFLVAVKGSVGVAADDSVAREEFLLDRPNVGLHLPPRTWAIQYGHTPDAVLLVFASHHYEAADYIRDYGEFQAMMDADRPRP